MQTAKKVHDPIGTGVAAGLVLLGIFLAFDSRSMTALGSVFPITISVTMILLGLILIVRNVILARRGVTPPSQNASEGGVQGGSNTRRLLFVLAMIAWIALVPVLGFMTASFLAYFAIMGVATHERMPAKEIALLVVLGAAILVGFYLLMSRVLLIPIPTGIFF